MITQKERYRRETPEREDHPEENCATQPTFATTSKRDDVHIVLQNNYASTTNTAPRFPANIQNTVTPIPKKILAPNEKTMPMPTTARAIHAHHSMQYQRDARAADGAHSPLADSGLARLADSACSERGCRALFRLAQEPPPSENSGPKG